MNTTLSPNASLDPLHYTKINQYGYGIAFSVSILIVIVAILLASYLCTRVNVNLQQRPVMPLIHDIETGLDEETIMGYPKVRYSEKKQNMTGVTCCSICLADYSDSDELRQLPDCGHVFHVDCVDPWLRLHPSCPLCRTSPLSTPLAEVVPLAREQ